MSSLGPNGPLVESMKVLNCGETEDYRDDCIIVYLKNCVSMARACLHTKKVSSFIHVYVAGWGGGGELCLKTVRSQSYAH